MKFGVSISCSSNQKMVGEFCLICQNMGFLINYLGGIHGFLTGTIDVSGVDFTSFII